MKNIKIMMYIIIITIINYLHSAMLRILMMAFSSGENDVHPYSHSFRTRCHQMISSGRTFYNKCHSWIWRFERVQMIYINFFYSLKVCTTSWLSLRLVTEIGQSSRYPIKHKPSFVPM
uniref:Uncharacterized protein n=1 Tax=Panstrongylus lignarius TaxID=156445 RepID=A0A224XPN9_9HEMI